MATIARRKQCSDRRLSRFSEESAVEFWAWYTFCNTLYPNGGFARIDLLYFNRKLQHWNLNQQKGRGALTSDLTITSLHDIPLRGETYIQLALINRLILISASPNPARNAGNRQTLESFVTEIVVHVAFLYFFFLFHPFFSSRYYTHAAWNTFRKIILHGYEKNFDIAER